MFTAEAGELEAEFIKIQVQIHGWVQNIIRDESIFITETCSKIMTINKGKKIWRKLEDCWSRNQENTRSETKNVNKLFNTTCVTLLNTLIF